MKASFKAGLRHGQCEVTFAQGDIRSIKGEYRAGRLSGRARVVFSPGNSLDGFFSAWWRAWCRTVSGGVLVPVLASHQKVLHTRQLSTDTGGS